MKNIFKKSFSAIMLIAVLFAIVGCTKSKQTSSTPPKASVQKNIPTIFVHGWGSSAKAEEYMTQGARKAGVTNTIVRANVSKGGKVTFNRKISRNAKNPIIEVNLEDNKLSNYTANYPKGFRHGGGYIKNVIIALQKMNNYKSVNFVLHSMGNLEAINYINDNLKEINSKRLPRINKIVSIAGPFNGTVQDLEAFSKLDKSGKPSKIDESFEPLMSLHKTFPKNISVLNIYGNVGNGEESDEAVPINSAKSLKYLSTPAKSYKAIEISGTGGQHSRLHHNDDVNKSIIKFLWK